MAQFPATPVLQVPATAASAVDLLFRALAAQETGRAPDPFVIMQLGDSHSAGDYFSARMRELFQARFGSAGRGLLPPGMADRYYNPRLVSVQATVGWTRAQASPTAENGPLGVAGIRQDALLGGENLTLRGDEAAGFDTAYLTLLRQPGGGSLRLTAPGATPAIIPTAGDTEAPFWVELNLPPGTNEWQVDTLGDGPISLLSWGAHRHGRGVLYNNFGIIGTRVDVLGQLRPDIVALEWRHQPPKLIVLIYGTNEAFGPANLVEGYEQLFTQSVATLVANAPGAAVLVIGPPDGNRRARPQPGQSEAARVCGTTPARPRATTRDPGIRDPGPRATAAARAGQPWVRPAQLDLVNAAQRDAAARNGWLFWDWSAAMGGPCAMQAWTRADPPLGQPDHIHLTQAGYQRSAEQLFGELMERYAAWRTKNP